MYVAVPDVIWLTIIVERYNLGTVSLGCLLVHRLNSIKNVSMGIVYCIIPSMFLCK